MSFEKIEGTAGGWCDPKRKRIVIDADAPANARLRTLIHECAHALGIDYEQYSRAQAEVRRDRHRGAGAAHTHEPIRTPGQPREGPPEGRPADETADIALIGGAGAGFPAGPIVDAVVAPAASHPSPSHMGYRIRTASVRRARAVFGGATAKRSPPARKQPP